MAKLKNKKVWRVVANNTTYIIKSKWGLFWLLLFVGSDDHVAIYLTKNAEADLSGRRKTTDTKTEEAAVDTVG